MEPNISKKLIVVTGASRGIGRAICERFAKDGYTIVMNARDAATLAGTATEIAAKYGVSCHHFAADLSENSGAIAFAEWFNSNGFKAAILVNNAGGFVPGSIYDEPEGTLQQMISGNLYGAYYLTRQLLPPMMERKQGHIFNICSIAALTAYANGGSYSISKFALAGFSKNLREELKPFNIKVTTVYPGAVYTASWEGSGVDPNRIMEPNDIAEVIFTAAHLSPQACMEEVVLRPQLGDL